MVDKPNPSTSWTDGLCCPSLAKRRGVAPLPSLFEKRGAGGEFFSSYSINCFCDILLITQTLQGEPAMAKDKDKGKEKGNKPKLSVKEKKLKKKEKRDKKTSML